MNGHKYIEISNSLYKIKLIGNEVDGLDLVTVFIDPLTEKETITEFPLSAESIQAFCYIILKAQEFYGVLK